MAERAPVNWLRTEPSETPLAQLARRLSEQSGAGGAAPVGSAAPPPERSAREVWALAKQGAAPATDRWRLWQDEAFWAGGAPDPTGRRLIGLEAHEHLCPELMWFFNQPGAGLAPTLRVLLSSSPWCLPLIDPAELGRAAATEAMPPRELLRQWGAGPSAPGHMAAAIEHYAKLLCARVTSDHGAGLLSESAVDAQLYAALCGESMAAPRWTTEPGQLTPAERGAVDAMMKAVPPAMWGMLLKTRGLLLDWQQTRAEEIGPKGVAAIDRLHGFTASDQLLRSAEVIAGREYTFVQAVWDRQRNKEQISSGDRDTANILKRVGFFMNYASSIRACALVGDRDGAGQGRPGHPPVIRPSSIGSGRVGDRIVLRFKNHELLVKLSGRDQPGDPIIRCFQPRAPASASTGLAIDLQLWAKRVQRIADDQTPEGEVPNRGWTMAGQAWQPDLMRGLAREGLLPDAGLGLVRGTPSWHQSRSMELIEQLRRGA